MAEAQFQPGGPANAIPNALNTGLETGLSMMDRASRRRMAEETHAMQMQQEEILRPVREAKANADIEAAKAHIIGLKQTEDASAAVNAIVPQARADFDEMLQLADPDFREQAAYEWIGKYGQIANVKTFAGEWGAKKDIVAKIHQDASTLRMLSLKTETEKEAIAARGETATGVATIRADATRDAAMTRAHGATPEAVKLREAVTQARDSGDEQGAADFEAILKKRGFIPDQKKLKLEKLRELRQLAKDDGDTDGVKEYSDAIAKEVALTVDPIKQKVASMIPGGDARNPATPSPSPAPAPKAPAPMTPTELNNFFFGPKK